MKARTIAATLIAFCISLIAVTIVAQESKPGAPTITSVGGAPTTLTVVWTAPNSDGGANITRYDVRYIGSAETDRADERWTGPWTSGSLTYTITGLPGNVSYDVQVRAVNENGAGDWSETGTAVVSDPPQVSVSLGQSAYTVLEGVTLAVPITLSAAPQRTVTIPIQVRNGYRTYDDDYSVLQRSVRFDPGQTEGMVAFTANLDRSVDGGSVQLSFGTLPEGMTAGATSQATVSITDATLLVKFKLPRGSNPYYDNSQFTVKEGHTVDVTVELSPAPQRTVVIPLIPVHNGSTTSADYSMPANVTFNSGETSKTFTFEAIDDDENDDSNSVVIDFNASRHSFSPGVGAAPPTWTTIFITDNDDPQVEVTFGLGSIRVSEGESRGVTVWLSTDPERTVVIPFTVTELGGATSADYSVPTSVEFRSGQREKTLWLRAIQDTVYDEGESVRLAFGELPDRVSVGVLLTETTFKIDDDDAPQVTVSFEHATYTVDEGDTEQVTVSLSADPQRRVTIGITTRGWGGLTYADYSGVPESLTFDSGETSKSFHFTAMDDTDNDNDESVQLGFWPLSTGVTVGTPGQTTLNINDTDLPWVVFVSFDRTRYIVNEGETEHIVVKLNRAPDHAVVIPIAATGQLGASSDDFSVQTSVTFNAQDRSKTIAFTATQDTVDDEGKVVRLTFGTLPNRVVSQNPMNKIVEINDDDGAAVSVSETALSIGEGSFKTYTVVLKSPPTAAVVVTINSPSNNTEVTAAPASLTFTSSNWSSAQTVTVSAAHDTDEDDETTSVTHTVSSSDNSYSGATANSVVVSVIDDDDPQVTVSFDQATYTVAEGADQSMTVTLNRDPERRLVIPITVTPLGSASAADYSLSSTSVTFSRGNTVQMITFTANQDSLDDDDERVVLAFGTDLPIRVTAGTTATVSITDDDDPLLTVSYGPAMYTVAEGETVTVTVTLNADPERTVVIPLTATGLDGATAGDYSVSPTSVTFDSGDMSETITFTATQDRIDDDGERVRLGFASLPSGVSAGTQATVSITDDDGAGVTVSETVLNVGEGSSETYTIVLASQPTADVIVTINDPSNTHVTADPDNLTFTMSDWSSAQTVTVSAAQDADAVDETATVTHSVTSGDNSYNGAPARSITVNVTDDDNRQVTVSYEPAMYTVAEGEMVTVTVTLNADPERPVVIPLTATGLDDATAGDYSVSPTSVTFDSGDMSETITFTATQDRIDDDGERVRLGFGMLPDGVSAGSTATVSITDDDGAGVTVSETVLNVGEGSSETYTIVLASQPTANVTVTINDPSVNTDVTAEPASLIFSSSDWSTAKTVTVNVAQDEDAMDETATVTHSVTSTDSSYSGASANNVVVSVTDNDDPQVTVSFGNTAYTVAEGNSVTVTVTLSAVPERTVDIPITHMPKDGAIPDDYSGVPTNLIFSATETSKTITFEATQDMIDDDGESVLLGFGTLPLRVSAGATATVNIDDDDGVGVTVSEASLGIGEGGSGTYTIKLDSQPTANVTVTINDPSVNTDVTAEPASLIFSSSDWSTAQTVTVNVAQDEDAMDETATVTHSVTSTDSSYSGASANNVVVSVTDNDDPQVTVSFGNTAYTVAEGNSVTVTVTLSAVPERMVDIPITHMPKDGAIPDDYSGVPTNLIFSETETSKTITFEATQDMIDDDGESVLLGFGTLPLRVSAGATATATVNIDDDDGVGVTVSEASLGIGEGGSGTYTIKLDSQPTANVTVTINDPSVNTDVTAEPASLIFSSSDWSTAQTVTVNVAQDEDAMDETATVTHSVTSTDSSYSGASPNNVVVSVTDNDDPQVTVSFGNTAYTVAEGNSVTVTVTLSAVPERTVDIPITHMPKDGAIPDDYSGVPTNLIFSATETSKTITFEATQDMIDDDGESVLLGFGTLPLRVSAGATATATVSIDDDDGAGVTVSEASLGIGEGSSETYTIVLASQPTADVIVTINDPSNTDVTAHPDILTFTMSDWSSAQTVTVSAAQDTDAVDETATVTHSVTSGDNSYNGAPAPSITVNVTDDENRQVTVSYGQATYTVVEGDMVTVTVTLNADPERTVVIPLTATPQGGASSADYSGVPASLTFTSGDMSKTFTVTATDDVIDDDGESVRLDFRMLPSGVSAGTTATVSITDNDNPQVTVSYGQATYTVVEGDMVTVTVTLNADPERTVVIPLTATPQGGASSADYSGVPLSLSFNARDRSKSFSFSALEDDLGEDGERVLLAFETLPDGVSRGRPNEATVNLVDEPGVEGSSPGRGGGGGGGPPSVLVPSDVEFDWNVTRDIESLHRDNDLPTGLWSNGEVLWVVENSASGADRLFAYNLNTGERLEEHEFELDARNRFSHGIWSNGELVWIADSGQDKLFAYQLETGERVEERDLELDERNRDPREIWSDGELILVLDSVKKALFVYELESGQLLAEYPLDKLNQSPRGIWSDSFTIWVSDDGANRIFAYRIEGEMLNRHEDQEFTFRSLLKASNGDARGIWSDGDVIFVADEQDEQIYTYNMPDALDARLASLTLSGVEFGEFSAGRTEYAAVVDSGLAQTTVEAEAAQSKAGIEITPADADGDPSNGHQARLIDGQEITVEVTSADGSRTVVYRVGVSHCLSGLSETRLNSVQFVGGSVEALGDCAQSLGVDALYHYRDSAWVGLFLDAPEFLNRPFRDRFAEGVPGGEVLIGKRDAIQITTQAVSGAG